MGNAHMYIRMYVHTCYLFMYVRMFNAGMYIQCMMTFTCECVYISVLCIQCEGWESNCKHKEKQCSILVIRRYDENGTLFCKQICFKKTAKLHLAACNILSVPILNSVPSYPSWSVY